MDINKLIKDVHANAVSKGFYEEERSVKERLMLVVSELGEAIEAHRTNRFTKYGSYKVLESLQEPGWTLDLYLTMKINSYFESSIKDTFQDEIADVFIRLLDLCGYMEIEPTIRHDIKTAQESVGENLFCITGDLQGLATGCHETKTNCMSRVLSMLLHFSGKQFIDIEKHIQLKMVYNKNRPYKHGKEY